MWRVAFILLLLLLEWRPSLFAGPLDSNASDGLPDLTTPGGLAEAWVRFHERGLCQGLDAAFEFHEKGMTVTGTILDEKSYEKFQELLQPLDAAFVIEMHLERLREQEKTADKTDKDKDYDPPASLWENYELRSFLGDPVARARERTGFDDESNLSVHAPDEVLKQRLRIYAEQMLAWNTEIERYAKHLPDLVQMATDSGLKQHLRAQAGAAAMAHAREIDRLLGKLSTNLAPALPHSRKVEPTALPEKSRTAEITIADRAKGISESTKSVSSRIYHFIHPEHYTVDLHELRQPSLLVSLKDLQKANADFRKALQKAK